MAKVRHNQAVTYILRESVKTGDGFAPKDICDLGPRPGAWIDYPGGNAWYVCPELETRVANHAITYSPAHLEDLFWPFLHPGIQRATEAFRNRAPRSGFKRTSQKEKQILAQTTHAFDKRRAHFLKFGSMDQGPLINIPAVLFKPFRKKSRDEIEQWFMAQERHLRPKELKSYVYTIFDIQRFFQGFLAKQMPHALDQSRVEAYFLEEICALNLNLYGLSSHLHEYMIRYLIMFFDFSYEDTVLLDDLERDFRARHRYANVPPKPSVTRFRARQIFGITKAEFKAMDKKTLTRTFRKLAQKHHPDAGGDHDKFVALTEAYQALMEKMQAS